MFIGKSPVLYSSTYLSAYLYIYLSIHLPIHLSIYSYRSICPYIYLSINQSINLSFYISIGNVTCLLKPTEQSLKSTMNHHDDWFHHHSLGFSDIPWWVPSSGLHGYITGNVDELPVAKLNIQCHWFSYASLYLRILFEAIPPKTNQQMWHER